MKRHTEIRMRYRTLKTVGRQTLVPLLGLIFGLALLLSGPRNRSS